MNSSDIESVVRQWLDDYAVEDTLRDIISHGIHNLTSDFSNDSDELYYAYQEEFFHQCQVRLEDDRYRHN